MLLGNTLEKCQAEQVTFPFIDACCEVIVELIAKGVANKKTAAPMNT